ncbi:3'(2'),5'-bisphosphate nucleotidase [Devosia sp. DBB001]|nr:3'(2'),5'-bisphosphate nucleotidase [Devosia sp. DBB001]
MTDLLELMLDASIAAARVINDVYSRPFEVIEKSDGSPVTQADAAAEAVILRMLAPTGIPVLAEESAAAGRIPVLGDRFFVVDPLDGTKEFVKRNGEFTVNIALVEHGAPTLGVVLAPATGECFAGSKAGAFACRIVDGRAVERVAIHVDCGAPMRVVASRSHGHRALASLIDALKVESDVSVGSSLKFCLLARGDAQLYPRFTPTSEWDTAAGQAVLEGAGGVVITLDEQPLRYGKAANGFINPFFVAASSPDLARKAAMQMRDVADLQLPD